MHAKKLYDLLSKLIVFRVSSEKNLGSDTYNVLRYSVQLCFF